MPDLEIVVALKDVPPPARLLNRVGEVTWQNIPAAFATFSSGSIRMAATGRDGDRVVLELLNAPSRDLIGEIREREAEHRSRNIISLALAVARQSFRGEQDNPAISAFIDRLQSLESVVRIGCEVEGELCSLPLIAERVTGRFEAKSRSQIERSGSDILVASRAGHIIALALHELSANAIRHGALSVADGRIYLSWALDDLDDSANRLSLSWIERGGPSPARDWTPGTGMQILDQLASTSSKVSARFSRSADSIEWTMTMRLGRREVEQRSNSIDTRIDR